MGFPSSLCRNCGGSKQGKFLDDYCGGCVADVAGAEAAAAAAGQDTAEARRQALQARAHQSRRNYVDPRAINRRTMWNYGNAPGAIPTEGASD